MFEYLYMIEKEYANVLKIFVDNSLIFHSKKLNKFVLPNE